MTRMWLISAVTAADVLREVKTEHILLKPRTAWGGAGIIVTTPQEFSASMFKDGVEYICEEFIESRQGIPGLVNGRHDLRLHVHNGVVSVAEIRQPKGDGVLANVALGDSLFEVELERVPQWALDMVPVVEKHVRVYGPRIYTIAVWEWSTVCD